MSVPGGGAGGHGHGRAVERAVVEEGPAERGEGVPNTWPGAFGGEKAGGPQDGEVVARGGG